MRSLVLVLLSLAACHYKGLGEACSQIDNCAEGLSCVNARCVLSTSGTLPRLCRVICWSCSFNGWGALAYSPSTGACGSSWDYGSESAAKGGAISACAESDCRIVSGPDGNSAYRNQCSALAIQTPFSVSGTWATSGRQTAEAAQIAAVANCID